MEVQIQQVYLRQITKLMKKEQYKQAICLILKTIESNKCNNNYKLYCMLGDINTKLTRYENAKRYYQRSLEENDKCSNTYYKFGHLLHHHLKDYQESEKMYEQCLIIDPIHEECLFESAKLMTYLTDNFSKGKELFKKLVREFSKNSYIYYEFAIALITQKNTNDQENIQYLLHKAMILEPTNIKFHEAFAKYSETILKYNQANHFYKIILKMQNYSEAKSLAKYSKFLNECMNDKKNSLKYMKMAYELNDEYKSNYLALGSISMTNIFEHHIKLIVYDFETIMIYQKSNKKIDNLDRKKLKFVFGGQDRINEFKKYFEKCNNLNVQNVILSTKETNSAIYKCLTRLGLLNYVKLIIGIDNLHFLSRDYDDKIYEIIKIKDDFSLNSGNEILYISCNSKDVEDLSNECKTYFIKPDKSYPFPGPTIDDFHEFICMVINPKHVIDDKICQYDVIKSLKELNEPLLNKITIEVFNHVRYNKPIMSMKFISDQQSIDYRYCRFVEYCDILKIAIIASNNYEWWVSGHYFQKIVNENQSEIQILRRFAKCCSYLRHDEAADSVYNIALSINPNDYYTLISAAYHQLMCGHVKQSKELFLLAKKSSRYTKMSKNLIVGLARTSELSGELDVAEKYYQIAIKEDTKPYEPAHYFYGLFLEGKNLLFDAMEQFKMCLHIFPNKVKNHLKMCDISWKLHDLSIYEYHMAKSLQIDPYAVSGIHHYEMYYKKLHNIEHIIRYSDDIKRNENYIILSLDPSWIDVNIDVEFDSFWFDHVGIINSAFNQYYDNFVLKKMNSMNWLLNDDNFAKKLKEIIKVNDPIHLEFISSKVIEMRKFNKNMQN